MMTENSSPGEEELSKVLLRYSGLVAIESKNGISLQGHVKMKEKHHYINLRLPKFPKLNDFILIARHGINLRKYTERSPGYDSSWKIGDLLENLPLLLNAHEDDKLPEIVPESTNSIVQTTLNLYEEIAALYNPEFAIELNESCTLIRCGKFLVNEQHYLEVELPSLNIRAHSLPDCIKAPELLAKCESLTAIVLQFQKYVDEVQPFYDCFVAIDELCYVVQPANPTTKHNYRLFVLRERVFLKLVITDPFMPLASMSVHIIGPTAEVEQLRRTYSEGLKNWDNDMDIQKNLLRIFDLCFFPMPPEPDSDEQEQWFCNICYSYRLEPNERGGCDVPIVSCDNPQCTLIFHDACLLEWFSTLLDNVSFLNVSFGNCPFCKAKLSTSFQELQVE